MRRIYQWEQWFQQGCITLCRGTHYWISQGVMYQTIRNNASRRGLRVRLKDHGDRIDVEVIGGTRHNTRSVVSVGGD